MENAEACSSASQGRRSKHFIAKSKGRYADLAAIDTLQLNDALIEPVGNFDDKQPKCLR